MSGFALRRIRASLLLIALAGFSWTAQAQLDNRGTDFILAYMLNFDSDVTLEVHLASDVTTMVTIEYPVNAPTFTTTVAVNPGAVTIVELPDTAATAWAADTVQNNLVRAFADEEFVAYTVNRRPFTSDAALGLPIDTMNTEYIAIDYDPTFNAEFLVYAAFDDTTVTITPKNSISGHGAGIPFSVNLDRGEGYLALSTSTGTFGSLTGSIITADRPVGMINGNRCVNVPNNASFCDHIYEVAQPVQTWGGEVLVENLPNRALGVFYRIVAAVDNTEVFQDGASIGTIDRGEFIEIAALTGSHVFASQDPANVPIYVVQYMPGSQFQGGNGDPAQGNMIPSEQYLREYTFSTVGGNQFVENFLTVIAANAELDDVLLDGAPIGAGAFSPIAGTNFSSAVVVLSDGTHTTSSPAAGAGHGITVEGYNQDDSYLYPGGARFEFITAIGDDNPPLCSAQTFAGPPPFATGQGDDSRPSEDVNGNGELDPGEDLNDNGQIDEDTGVFFVALAGGSSNLSLAVDPFVPGDPVVNYQVNLIDPGVSGNGNVIVTDGAGNTCTQPIELLVDVQPPMCDLDEDQDVDRDDVKYIFSQRGTVVTPGAPGDIDGDGTITVLDARLCVLQCDLPNCAPVDGAVKPR